MQSKTIFFRSIIIWSCLFLGVVILPMFITSIGHNYPNRGFWVEFGSGLGFVALSMMILQFLLTARFRNVKPGFGHDGLLYFHRQAGLIAWFFVIGHFTVLFLADPAYTNYLDPSVNAPRTISLIFVVILLTLLLATSYWRKSFGLSYEWWRLTHGIAAAAVVLIGLGHALMVDHFTAGLWRKAFWVLFTGWAMVMLLHIRIGKPYQISKFPYKVTDIRKEAEQVWTLALKADDHHGMTFRAGQFAWLTIADTPFKLQQHPFSFTSSTESDTVEFTIKELGDFTGTIGQVQPGATVFLEGPYGTYTLPPDEDAELVFFAGGIGITPFISMLRTMRDKDDRRRVTLLYGNKDDKTITFFDELGELTQSLNLTVVHVLEEPPEEGDWEEGFIDADIMKRHLPDDPGNVMYYVNGPPVMQDAIETTLKQKNVPLWRMRSESFEIV